MPTRGPNGVIEFPAGDTAARALGASRQRYGPFASLLLASLEILYGVGVRLRNRAFDLGLRRAQRATIPVISVGNIVAGGAGKTPFTRWLVQELMQRGRRTAILHGGYGSDEPELHRQWLPTAIVLEQRDRVAAAAAAARNGADVVVLDDAFQHRRLSRDLDIVLVPVETPSAHLLPRGPLREPPRALVRAHAVVVTRKTATPSQAAELAAHIREEYGTFCAVAALLPAGLHHAAGDDTPPRGKAVVVAAVARPDLLLQHVRAQGIDVVKLLAYPDHHEYTDRDREHIRRIARGLPIITTAKDAVKLLSLFAPIELWVLGQEVVIEQGRAELLAMIERVL
jgi:tetraacyldisaccharide 4'-kinase